MKYDLNLLNNYIERGYLVKQDHPTLPLSIYNYSRTCQYEGRWDDITLNMRGMILDNEGNVVARSFPKFFNMEEMKEIPNEPFQVYEKMDGSLGIVFHYNGEWHLASKGSFISEQAIKGREMLYTYDTSKMNKHYTYLFEIIYKENRIVVDYDFDDLVLLSVMDSETGAELSLEYVNTLDFKVVKKYNGIIDYKVLKTIISNNQEGFVVKFSSGTRMKIKGEEYVRLHRIMTGLSNVDIWEILKNGEDIEQYLEKVPDEFDKWVRNQVMNLNYAKYWVREHCGKIHDYFRYGKYGDVDPEPTKKDFALHLDKYVDKQYKSILFAMWDRRDYEHMLWKIIKPKYQKPVWQDDEMYKLKQTRPEFFNTKKD
jgi:RNA ligase